MFRMAHYHTTLTISALFTTYCSAYYVKFMHIEYDLLHLPKCVVYGQSTAWDTVSHNALHVLSLTFHSSTMNELGVFLTLYLNVKNVM